MLSIALADHIFHIRDHYPFMRMLCRDYLTDEVGGISLSITKEELLAEQTDDQPFDPGYLESLAYYRKIAACLLQDDILLYHASALALDGRAVLFTAPSGTGKSTHARLWRAHFGERAMTINDDKPLLHIREDGVTAFGTPYAGKEALQTNTRAPVHGIVILRQAPENTIRRLTSREAFPTLLSQTHRPAEPEALLRTVELVSRLSMLPVYELGCTISDDAVTLCADAVFGNRRTS